MGDFTEGPAVSHDPDLFEFPLQRWVCLHLGSDTRVDSFSPATSDILSATGSPARCLPEPADNPATVATVFSGSSPQLPGPAPSTSLTITNFLNDFAAVRTTSAVTAQFVLPSPVFPLPHVPYSLAPLLDTWLDTPIPYYSPIHPPPPVERPVTVPLLAIPTAINHPVAPPDLGENNDRWLREDIALVLGCDGLFDVVDNQLLAEIVCPWMEDGAHDVFNDPVFDPEHARSRKKKSDARTRDGTAPDAPITTPPSDEGDGDELEEDEEDSDELLDPLSSRFAGPDASRLSCNHYSSSAPSQCRCHLVSKGQLAELAALRLRSCADALDSTDNVSLIVIML
jgi:hypothetical protein